jgi:hypothetical protein
VVGSDRSGLMYRYGWMDGSDTFLEDGGSKNYTRLYLYLRAHLHWYLKLELVGSIRWKHCVQLYLHLQHSSSYERSSSI